MKKLTLLTAALLLSTLALGQTTLIFGQSNLRPWDRGPLTWSDFSVVDQSIGQEHSYLEYLLDIESRTQEIEGSKIPVRMAVAYMDKHLSWVDSSHRTPQELRYNRVLFNIVELHRRRLQIAIDTGNNINMDYHMRLLTHVADSFCRSTAYGRDTVAVAWWEYDIRRQLDSINPILVAKHNEATRVTAFKPTLSFSMSLGLGTKFFTGDLHNLFAPSAGFYMDVDGGLHRSVFTLGFYFGGGRCKPDSIITVKEKNKLYWYDDLSTLDFHIDYGYNVLDRTKITLTPFVGYGLQAFLYDEGDNTYSNGPAEGCWRLGLDFKYDFGQEGFTIGSTHTLMACALHSKVYISFDRLRSIVGTPQGTTLNAQLGISFRARHRQIIRNPNS